LRLLITGGLGYVGSNIIPFLLKSGHKICIVDCGMNAVVENVQNTELVIADVCDEVVMGPLIEAADIVLHLAAETSVVQSGYSSCESLIHNNVTGLEVCARLSAKYGRRFIFASSAAVYGERSDLSGVSETDCFRPISPYGSSKLFGESLVLTSYKDLPNLCSILRFFNIFGGAHAYRSAYSGVISRFLYSATMGQETLKIYGDGKQTRDFIHINDVGRCYLEAIKGNLNGIVNIGTGKATTVNDLAQFITRLKPELKLEFQPRRAQEIIHSVADISALKERIGFIPNVSVKEYIEEQVGG